MDLVLSSRVFSSLSSFFGVYISEISFCLEVAMADELFNLRLGVLIFLPCLRSFLTTKTDVVLFRACMRQSNTDGFSAGLAPPTFQSNRFVSPGPSFGSERLRRQFPFDQSVIWHKQCHDWCKHGTCGLYPLLVELQHKISITCICCK